ncbi:helix-turn-helix domain-containing protein [Streptomyces griseorubiginosus]|uniref:helix-turn-helix domain-containing protein n=1 Tax=Streptomyces griseorubiginosus TaxID=67304 RepID=UPI0036BD2D2F
MPRDLPEDDDWINECQQNVGRRIQAERLRQDLTQEAVYLAAGLDRRTLQTIESGVGNPTLATLLKLAHVLDVDVAEFMR